MVAEARLKSKNLYKVELYLLKIMPMVIALAYLVNTVSSYFGVDIPITCKYCRNVFNTTNIYVYLFLCIQVL